jgi:adenosylmethionine-8-amino-7-oxononanoate aminotransferase
VRRHLEEALGGSDIVREVRGQGFLFGIEYVDPRDGESFLPPELAVARRIDIAALENEVLLYSTQPTVDGYAGDQTLLAPAFTATDAELGAMVERVAASVATVEAEVKHQLISKDAKPVAV